jgi:hypothetical protein
MKKALFLLSMFLFALPAFAAAPVCMYQDVQSGPATGGEGGNGIYLDIYGLNFGSSQGSSTVTVNGTPVAQYLVWGADPTGDRQQIGVQIASGTTGTGNIVVTTSGGSCSNLTFTVRTGHIYFIGPSVDTSAPASCATMEAANSYSTPWGLTNYNSPTEANYNPSTMRTPYTYYTCLAHGDTLIFLNGVSYPYFDGRQLHASFTYDDTSTTSTGFITVQARPGATATLGGGETNMDAMGHYGNTDYNVIAGMSLVGQGTNGAGINAAPYARIVGNTMQCPSCYSESGGGWDGSEATGEGMEALGNNVLNVSTNTTLLPLGSNKQYHDVYMSGNNFEVAWNRISNTAAYNGIQVNQDSVAGSYNFTIHDNDIADVNGSGINLSTIDPSSGYVQVYNNIIHHTGLAWSSDGGNGDPHNCIAVKGYGSATAAGTAEIYNNTMYDCNSVINAHPGDPGACAVMVNNDQFNVTTNLVNNIVYQPAYAGTSAQNVYMCAGGSPLGTYSGSNNIWYSATTPGSTAYATAVGTIENPLYVTASDGAWTNYELQSSSPARGAGISVGPVELAGTSNTHLAWDFNHVVRPSPPSIGAMEHGSTTSGDQITIGATPNPATLGQSVTLTATVGQTATSVPTGSINFMNGSVSLGQAPLDSTGTATVVLSSLSVGSYAVVGSYPGDSHYAPGESSVASLQVLSTTATTLVASPNAVTAGQALDLTATVSASATTAPSGTVSFMNGSTVLGTASLNSSGVATLSTASLPAGTYSLTAQYLGSASFVASTSPAASVTVTASTATTTITLVASPNPVTAGQALDLTATVSASATTAPSGTVNFMNGTTVLGSASLNSSGVATLSTASLPTGTYSLTAQYTGTASFLASTSAAASVTVDGATATTSTSLVASPNPVTTGQTLNLVATVSASGTTSLSGTVSFMSGSTVLGTATLNSSGVATLSTASLPAGTYSLTAQYTGTASFLASTSAAASVTVDASTSTTTTTISLVASPNPVTEGQALILTATVSESGTTSPTGTVSFMNGSTVLGTAALNSSGVATLSITSLAVGTYSLTAQYPSTTSPTPQGSGSAGPVASASATVLVTVNAATAPIVPSFSMTVTGSTPSSVLPGETAVYSLVVTPTSGITLPAITFAASGLPAGATATFSPQEIAAGGGTTNVTLSIQTPAAQSARLERNRELGGGLPVVALCLLLLPFGRGSRRFGKRLMRLSSMLLLLAGAASLVGLTGCGADVYSLSAQTYTVTVTSASASVSQTAQVTLAVE